MVRRKRIGILSVIGALSAPVVVAGMAFACGPSGYGVPEKPAAPPTSTAAPVVVAPTAPPAAAPAPAATPARNPVPSGASGSESSSATTRGADSSTGSNNSGSGGSGSNDSGSGSLGTSQGGSGGPSGQSAIDARVAGSTAGVVQRGDQAVFRSSTAPKGKAGSPARAGSVSATDDLWTAAPSPRAASLASVAGEESGGLSSAMVAGIIVLSLGLMGLIGGVLVGETRRRRAEGTNR